MTNAIKEINTVISWGRIFELNLFNCTISSLKFIKDFGTSKVSIKDCNVFIPFTFILEAINGTNTFM